MAGELREGRVVVDDSGEGSALYNRGFFGRPQPGGGVELNLLEAVYLVEAGRLEIRRRGKPVPVRELFRAANAAIDAFEIRYLVYRDLRARGYVVEARDGPVDFQVYPRGGAPKKTPSKYWVRALSERAVFDLAELLDRADEAASVRKTLLLGLVREAKAIQPDFELRLRAYEDLSDRGVISKTGFKYGSHFRAYEGDPDLHHAKYLVHVVPKGHRGAWPEISRAVRLAHGVKKQILFGEVGDGVRYVKLERVRP